MSIRERKHTSDYSLLHSRVLELYFRIELMMHVIIKVLIVYACQCFQQENVERKIMEKSGDCDSSNTIS